MQRAHSIRLCSGTMSAGIMILNSGGLKMGKRIMISRLEHFQSRPTVYGLPITSNHKKPPLRSETRVLNTISNLETSQKMLESKVGRDWMGLYPLDYYAARPFNPPLFGYDVRRHNVFKFRRIENGKTHNDIKVRTFSITPYRLRSSDYK